MICCGPRILHCNSILPGVHNRTMGTLFRTETWRAPFAPPRHGTSGGNITSLAALRRLKSGGPGGQLAQATKKAQSCFNAFTVSTGRYAIKCWTGWGPVAVDQSHWSLPGPKFGKWFGPNSSVPGWAFSDSGGVGTMPSVFRKSQAFTETTGRNQSHSKQTTPQQKTHLLT